MLECMLLTCTQQLHAVGTRLLPVMFPHRKEVNDGGGVDNQPMHAGARGDAGMSLEWWSLGAAGLGILALIYYISWRYLARWVCRLLLQERVVFPTSTTASIKEHGCHQNGRQNGIIKAEMEVSRSLKDHSTSATGSGAVQRQAIAAPCVVTDGVLAEVSQLIVGQVMSMSAVVAGVTVMYQTRNDVLHDKSWFLVTYVHTIVWYFALDSIAMFWSFGQMKDRGTRERPGLKRQLGQFIRKKWTFLLHHILILTVAYPLIVNYQLRRGMGDFFVGMLIIEDLSTPFLSAAKILRLLGLKNTFLYRINGLLLLTTFLLVRVLYTPLSVLIYAGQYHSWNVWSALNAMYPICHFFNTVQFILQTYWYLTIVSIALGTVRRTTKIRPSVKSVGNCDRKHD